MAIQGIYMTPYRFRWRITKYNPDDRDVNGYYNKDEWTFVEQLGDTIDGHVFTVNEYLETESKYVQAAKEFFIGSGIKELTINEFDGKKITPNKRLAKFGLNDVADFPIHNGQAVTIDELDTVIRLALRDFTHFKLEHREKLYIHFGWDYYMYIGSNKELEDAITATEALGLFVEEALSPYEQFNEIEISIEGASKLFPYRIETDSNFENGKDIDYYCIKSRNHNGYIREKALRKLADQNLSNYAIPYLVFALGDYVLEISSIPINTTDENIMNMKTFVRNNEMLVNYLDAKTISYWNEYYRKKFATYHDYPPYKFLQALKSK